MLLYTARHVLPVSSPAIVDGAVAVAEGRIVAIGGRADLRAAHPAAEVRDLGDAVVLPGLINAHTHLELSWLADRDLPSGDFMSWLGRVVELREAGEDESVRRQAAERAIAAMLARGTAAVGDVGNEGWTAPLLARSALFSVVFVELLGIEPGRAEGLLTAAAERLDSIERDEDVAAARDRIRIVLTAHGAHSTSSPLLKALAGRAVAARAPLSIHVAESREEVRLLGDGSGPFRDFLVERGSWDESFRAPKHTPVEQLDRLGALTAGTVAVHCVHLTNQDLSMLQSRGCCVVTCPRSNRRLGVGKSPVPRMLGSGIPVALGTDSLASAPDLDLFAEMAALREEHPGLAPAAVLRMATLNGARALGLEGLGSIAAGNRDRLVVVPLASASDDPLETVTGAPSRVDPLETAPFEGVAT